MAAFVVAAVEGSYGLAKNARSASMLRSNLELLSQYLDTLIPPTRPRAVGAGKRRKHKV